MVSDVVGNVRHKHCGFRVRALSCLRVVCEGVVGGGGGGPVRPGIPYIVDE